MAIALPTPISRGDLTHGTVKQVLVHGETGEAIYEFGVMDGEDFDGGNETRIALTEQQVADITAIALDGGNIPSDASDIVG